MKNWSIRRKIDSNEDIVYKFPDNFVLQSRSCVRIFSRNGRKGLVNQKEALVADNIPTWVRILIWLHDFLMQMEMKGLYMMKNSNK
ncbi:unnamed protein product [Adineta steineri]|uniref:LTD domain-containing protein n=1 Tax=Adineta steineri TaxID=433720 RepID=A0A820DRG3_9BILA|nr:unnamed protein product [Adineta steineri]